MKRTLLLAVSLVIFVFSTGIAGEVSKDDARKVAVNAYFEKINQYDRSMSFNDVMIIDEYTRLLNDGAAYFAFDFATGGYVIVSADNAYEPVIGYSFEGAFPKGQHAYVFSSFMQSYVDQIEYIRENNIQAESSIAEAWKHYSTNDISTLNISRDPRDVDPLLTNMWNQDSPYNLYCPEDAAGPSGRTYVGCVATAMSMIMHYYRYPNTGTGDHCYVPATHPQYGQQCADFEETTYEWNGMKDNIDGRYPWPVALIGYHCAVGVNMDFGPDGSGSYSYLVPGRLTAFFRYEDSQYLQKANYTHTNWVNLLKADLDQDMPLYYSGSSTTGGHAFVCDGYQGNDFHFNFGWSGYGNGFFSLTNVGGYYIGQGCVRNFYPSDPAYPYFASGQEVVTHPSGQIADGSGPIEDYQANTSASWLLDPQTPEDSITDISINFISFDLGAGDFLRIYDGETNAAPLLAEYTGSTLPDDVSSTGNKMLIEFTSDASGEGAGFKFEFDGHPAEFCGGLTTFTEPVGSFGDGSGTFNYSGGTQCMYKIDPPHHADITLTFTSFETEEGVDIVKVYDKNVELGTFSGSDNPGTFVCSSDFAFITFSTNSFNNFSGWELTYEIANVGVKENEVFNELNVFPNPATDALQVNFRVDNNQSVKMQLVSVTGDAVYSSELSNISGEISKSIDVSAFAKGVYILNLSSAEGSVNEKVIIK